MTLRIIAGEWRGRVLNAPKGSSTRPTADRTREALFSMLASRIGSFEGLRVADLFAGSGALGLEALSRGAAHCLFVEQDRLALEALRANAAKLGAAARAEIQAASALSLAPQHGPPPDLVLMDPPYGSGAGVVAAEKLARLGWIGPATLVSIETAHDEAVSPAGYDLLVQRRHGKALISLLTRQ